MPTDESEPITASALRQDIYRILDRILESGTVVEIERKGRILRIVPDVTRSRVARLKRRPYLRGDPEDIVHLDWSKEWRP